MQRTRQACQTLYSGADKIRRIDVADLTGVVQWMDGVVVVGVVQGMDGVKVDFVLSGGRRDWGCRWTMSVYTGEMCRKDSRNVSTFLFLDISPFKTPRENEDDGM